MTQPVFGNVTVGDALAEATFGPFTLVDSVRWAGSQELWEPLHFDRDYARRHSGESTIIASGGYRQALLVRMLTDWLGLGGRLRRLSIRHTKATVEGDLMRFRGVVVEKSTDATQPWIACDLTGANQRDETILTAHAVVTLPIEWSMP
jgi:acyl dehydratase